LNAVDQPQRPGPGEALPDERPASATRRTLAVELLVALAVVFAANLVAIEVGARGRLSVGTFIEAGKWRVVEELEQPVDWLIVGDSSAAFGVTRAELERGLGGRAINLATNQHQLVVGDAWMVQRYLERFPPPRGVIALHSVNVWWRTVGVAQTKLPLPWGYWDRLDPHVPFTTTMKWSYLTRRYLALWMQSYMLSTRVLNPFGYDDEDTIGEAGFISWRKNDVPSVNRMVKGHRREARRRGDIRLSLANRQGLEALIRLTERHGFDLFIGNGPICDQLKDDPDYGTNLAAVAKLLDVVDRRSRRVHHILREPLSFPIREMQNPDHLLRPAARRFTRALTAEIQAAAGRSP